MMPIVVKGESIGRATKGNAGHDWSWAAQESMG